MENRCNEYNEVEYYLVSHLARAEQELSFYSRLNIFQLIWWRLTGNATGTKESYNHCYNNIKRRLENLNRV